MKKYLLPALIALIGTAAIAFGQTAGKQIEVFLGPSVGKQWVSVASCIDSNNLWSCVGGSGSTPGGSNGQIQFNNSGSFGGTTTATGVLTMLGNTINGASGPIGVLTPTNNNCVVGNGSAWTSTTCPGGGGGGSLTVSTTGGSTVTGVTSITFPATIAVSGATPDVIASPATPVDDCQSGTCDISGSAAISANDAGYLILLGAHTYTLAQAGTGGFTAGWLPAGVMCVTGPCVITTTTSTFAPASSTSTLTMTAGEMASMRSNGTLYRTTIAAAGGAAKIITGTSALGTSAISSGTCATVVTTTATGVATTDVITAGFNGDPTGVTGYAPSASGALKIISYPSADNVNFKVCNDTAGSITPGAITLNWRVAR